MHFWATVSYCDRDHLKLLNADEAEKVYIIALSVLSDTLDLAKDVYWL